MVTTYCEKDKNIYVVIGNRYQTKEIICRLKDVIDSTSNAFTLLKEATITATYSINSLYDSFEELQYTIDKSLNAMSLKKLKELMFVPVKIELPNYYFKNKKHIYIRNQLPIKIRLND